MPHPHHLFLRLLDNPVLLVCLSTSWANFYWCKNIHTISKRVWVDHTHTLKMRESMQHFEIWQLKQYSIYCKVPKLCCGCHSPTRFKIKICLKKWQKKKRRTKKWPWWESNPETSSLNPAHLSITLRGGAAKIGFEFKTYAQMLMLIIDKADLLIFHECNRWRCPLSERVLPTYTCKHG